MSVYVSISQSLCFCLCLCFVLYSQSACPSGLIELHRYPRAEENGRKQDRKGRKAREKEEGNIKEQETIQSGLDYAAIGKYRCGNRYGCGLVNKEYSACADEVTYRLLHCSFPPSSSSFSCFMQGICRCCCFLCPSRDTLCR